MNDTNLERLLAIAKKSPGWNNRYDAPVSMTLAGGCLLIILAPTLWRGQLKPRPATTSQPIQLRRAS